MSRRLTMMLFPMMILSCGGSSSPEQGGPVIADEAEPKLAPVLEIGLEMGDSCYVFGNIRDACVMQDGTILVLDSYDNTISAFDASGEFIAVTGGTGEGPGEYLRPAAMIVMEDGRVLISDVTNTRVTILEPDLTVSKTISGFVPWSPERISAASGASYTGARRIFDRANSLYGHMVALWTDSPEPEMEYYREMGDFNMERLRESTDANQVVFTSDYDGRVYLAPYSTAEYRIDVYDSTGVLLYTIAEDREPVDRPEEDIQREMEEMREQLEREGAPEMAWNPVEQYYQIPLRGMEVDREGRLWVEDGRARVPAFSVYGEGELLFETELDSTAMPVEGLAVKVSPYGILAWEVDPETYPRVFVLVL